MTPTLQAAIIDDILPQFWLHIRWLWRLVREKKEIFTAGIYP